MFNFDEAKVLQEHKNGLSIVGATEKAVDEVVKRGYKNIFYIGIGGTVLYANQMAHIVREEGSTIPLFIENAADFCVVDNPHFSKDSVVVIESISGDTKEVVAAVDKAHEIGATVIGYVEKEGSPLYEKSDYLITTTGGGYYFWYTVTLRFMYHAGQFPRYEKFFEELKNMPENVVEIYKKADEKQQNMQGPIRMSPSSIWLVPAIWRTGLSAMACVSWKKCSGCAQGPYRPLISSTGHWRLLTGIPL